MELVNIKRLKATLREGELPARETAKYLAANAALMSLLFIPSSADAPLGWSFVAYPVLGVVGVYSCYRRNGGASGLRLAERYLAVAWVTGWRIGLFLGSLLILSAVFSFLFIGNIDWIEDRRFAQAYEIASFLAIALIYWRIGRHLADLRNA